MLLELENTTVLYITHDPEHARLADMVIFMQDGEIRQVIPRGEYVSNAYFCAWSNGGSAEAVPTAAADENGDQHPQ